MNRYFSYNDSSKSIFWEEDGFSTVGMVLALLITLSLIFTAARVYEINSASASIQETADAAALAAENVVGEFYILANVSDAVVFTLSLISLSAFGIGVACACTPVTASFSTTFLTASKEVKEARNAFAIKAVQVLNIVQKSLPFLANAKVQSVLAANSGGTSNDSFKGVALLSPMTCEDIKEPSFVKGDKLLDESDDKLSDMSKDGEKAEEAAKVANRVKQEAYEHDSGSQNSYCMYERAGKLAGMSGANNPFYSSVETWSFAAALNRSKIYYQQRFDREGPAGSSVSERSNSALRKKFYEYAVQEVGQGYVHESEDVFEAYFPLLPKNTSEMRETRLYTDSSYPITRTSSGSYCMHAWSGCPQIGEESSIGSGSIQQMEAGGYTTCSRCSFTASSMGKVAAASSNIDNGFEYHYNIVAKYAEDYEAARKVQDEHAKKVKQDTTSFFDQLKDALKEMSEARIEVDPPGKFGVTVLVLNTSTPSSSGHFSSSYVKDSVSVGVKAAISAATLVKESSDEEKTVINSFFDGLNAGGASVVAAPAKAFLNLWSGLLSAYTQGQESLTSGVKEVLQQIPLASESGLASWASKKFEKLIESLGLTAPELKPAKAVIVNSSHVLKADGSAFSTVLLNVKTLASGMNGGASLFGSALSSVEKEALKKVEGLKSEIEITKIELLGGAISIPIKITLPEDLVSLAEGSVKESFGYLQGLAPQPNAAGRRWQ